MLGLLLIVVGMLLPGAIGIVGVHNALIYHGNQRLATVITAAMVVVLVAMVGSLTTAI